MPAKERPTLTAAGELPRSTVVGASSLPSPAPRASRRSTEIPGLVHGKVRVADGLRLHYVVAGEGAPVLLLPGWPQNWYAWRFVIPQLVSAGRRVYAVDPRGFGDSDKPEQGYDLATAAHDIHVLIEELGLSDGRGTDVIAHDVGTWIAHALVTTHPTDVRRLVATDSTIPGVSDPPPAGYPDALRNTRSWHFGFNRVEGLPETLIHGREREFLAWFFGPHKATRTWAIDDDAFEEYLRVFSYPGAVRAGLMYYREAFSAEGLRASAARAQTRLPMPILTLGGADSDSDGLRAAFARSSDDVSGIVWEGIGHYLPEECPEELVEAVLEFWHRTDR